MERDLPPSPALSGPERWDLPRVVKIYLTVKRNCKVWELQELRLEKGKEEADLENRGFQLRFRSFVKSLRNALKRPSRPVSLLKLMSRKGDKTLWICYHCRDQGLLRSKSHFLPCKNVFCLICIRKSSSGLVSQYCTGWVKRVCSPALGRLTDRHEDGQQTWK